MFNVRRVVSMIEGRAEEEKVRLTTISYLHSDVQMYLLNCSNVYVYPFFNKSGKIAIIYR